MLSGGTSIGIDRGLVNGGGNVTGRARGSPRTRASVFPKERRNERNGG